MLRAELLALSTTTATKATAATALVGLAITQLAFVSLLPALARGDIGPGAEALGGDLPDVGLTTGAEQLDALAPLGAAMGGGSLGIVTLAVALLGTIAATSDFRYGGIVGAALAQPRRGRIVVTKAAATGVAAAALGVGLAALSALILLTTLVTAGITLAVDPVAVAGVVARGTVVVACLALIGLAVGMIARSQLSGVVAMLAVLLLEPLVSGVAQLVSGTAQTWTRFLPVALSQAAIGASDGGLPPIGALAALVALTGALLAVAAVFLRRRGL
ncbi:hypothetical protein [Microbacterium marinilacus]|uniref:ABC transporter permease n=1 Tax=Microbacterium marinilacus TaxID=415209 RepID=A0ABP7BKQ3_9MICO|nr:hypothetical protein [Microbacterium marinilacus]MBY0689787.1 hypothetical protein [Microbacterium marinilacus]